MFGCKKKKTKNFGRELGAWHQSEVIGGKSPVVK
jgi:hypothetical protein